MNYNPAPPVKINRSMGWNLERRGMLITQRIWDGPDCYQWMQVFAFWPVKTVSGKWIWLRKIYKRKCWVVWGTGFHMEPHVEYGTLFDMIKAEE